MAGESKRNESEKKELKRGIPVPKKSSTQEKKKKIEIIRRGAEKEAVAAASSKAAAAAAEEKEAVERGSDIQPAPAALPWP